MLTGIRDHARLVSATLLAMAIVATPLISASSANAADCTEVLLPDGTVKVICEDDGSGGEPGGGDRPGGGGGGGGGPKTCELDGRDVPCSTKFGSWNGNCYARTAQPQPGKDEGVWEGNDDGVIVECSPYECVGGPDPCPDATIDWAASPPAQVGPSAEELAARAAAQMNLTMGAVGSTPPSSDQETGAVGTIGLPIWLWIADRAENTTGPIKRSASGGGLTVVATGTLDRVEWTLTDANGAVRGSISCDGENASGTPYDGRDSAEPSPTCGFGPGMNGTPGNLTLTGTAYWSVAWEGGGQTGSIDVPAQTASAQVQIGELQALVER